MTGPAFGVRVFIDATGSKQGADTHVKSIEQIKGSTPQATATIAVLVAELRRLGIAENLVQRQTQTLVADLQASAKATEAAARATGTAVVRYQAQSTALVLYQKQVVSTTQATVAATRADLEAVRASIALKRAADERSVAITNSAAATIKAGAASGGAAVGSSRLTNSLQSLAFAATGLPGPLGRVASSLGALSVGGPLMIGITAGIAGIALVWDTLTRAGRDAKTATDELATSLLAAAKARSGETAQEGRAGLQARLAEQTAALTPFGLTGTSGFGPLDEARKKRKETIRELGELEHQESLKVIADIEARNAKDRERAAEQKRLLGEVARAARDAQKEVNDQMVAWVLHAKELVPVLKVAADVAIKLADAQGRAQGNQIFGTTGQLQNAPYTKDAARLGFIPDPDAIRNALRDDQERLRAASEARRELIRFSEELGLLPRSLVGAANAVSDLIEKIQDAGAKATDYVRVAAQVLGGLITGSSPGASGARGLLGGAAAGATLGSVIPGVGTIVGGVVGGILGGIGGLIGGGKNRREDIAAYQGALGAFQDQGAQRNSLQQTIVELAKQFDVLRTEALRLKQPVGDLTAAYQKQIVQAQAAWAEQQRAFQQSLEIRALVVQGYTEEAAALQQQIDMQAAIKAGYDATTLAQLVYVQGLETEAAAKRKAAEAAETANRDLLTGLSIAEREARLSGDTVGGLTAARDREYAEANRLRDTGGISNENYTRTINLIFGEFNKALQDLATSDAAKVAQEWADAAERLAVAAEKAAQETQRLADALYAEARATENLTVRSLRATGQDIAADIEAQKFAQAEERRQAILAGRSQEYLAELDRVLAQEQAKSDAARRGTFQSTLDQAFPTTGAASAAGTAVSASVTDRTALMLVDLTRAELSILRQIEVNTRGGGSRGSTDQEIDERLARRFQGQQIFDGDVSR